MTPQAALAVSAGESILPPVGDALIQWIAFVDRADDPRSAVVVLPEAGVHAVVVEACIAAASADVAPPQADLAILVVPSRAADAATLSPEWLAWVEAGGPSRMIALHGAAVAWAPGRAAILVETSRLEAVRAAVVEFCFRERELRAIEAGVTVGWHDVADDTPLAFEFRDRDAGRRTALAERFRRTVELRTRLVRLVPHLDLPPLHPPSLASQVAERLRERDRTAERAEHLAGQLEVQERVYDLCAQRSSDWGLAWKSIALEWAIVVLLAVETVLILVDLLAARGT